MTFDGYGTVQPNATSIKDFYTFFLFSKDFFSLFVVRFSTFLSLYISRQSSLKEESMYMCVKDWKEEWYRRTYKANKDIKMMDSVHLIPERDRVIFQRHTTDGTQATTLNVNSIIDPPPPLPPPTVLLFQTCCWFGGRFGTISSMHHQIS